MKLRIAFSLLLAAPLAVLSLAVADFGALPEVVRYAVSPGFIFGLHAAPSGSWVGDISNTLRIAIAGNEIYYAVLIFLVLGWWRRGRRNPVASSEKIVERQGQA